MISATFYADARERLVEVTDDAAIIAAFDRLTATAAEGNDNKTTEALGDFLVEAWRLNLSLDWIFVGVGDPKLIWRV